MFNDGWALVSESYKPDFSRITHIWISHEHPDHLHFPSLKSVPESERQRIIVLHQRHASPRVVNSIRKLGFTRITELPLYKWQPLTDGVQILCGSSGSMDSFLAVRDGKHTLLNMNDCIFNPAQLRYIKRKVGQIDILFTQFSFANWVGNNSDEIHGAERKIAQMKTQMEIFSPRYTVPFASFVYFCNQENSRMNKWANTPDAIAALGLPGVNFMYPGDVWDADAPTFDTTSALDRYRMDYAHTTIDPTPASKDIADVEAAVARCLGDFKAKLKQPFLNRLAPFAVYVHDLGKVIEIDPPTCTYKIIESGPEEAKAARFAMCSQVAWFTFQFPYGGGTTLISGMFLDREYEKYGSTQFFTLQSRLATEIFEFKGVQGSLRTANFWWRKKGELLYRILGRRDAPPDMDE